MKRFKAISAYLATGLSSLALVVAPVAAATTTVVVSPTNNQGWEFNSDRTTWVMGTGEFVDGPSDPPAGDGSARLTTPTDDNRTALRKYLDAGIQISDIDKLEYSTYRAEPTGGVLALALQFDVNFGATPVNETRADARIVYEPYFTQTVQDDVWQTWDALNDAAGSGTGNWWIAGAESLCPQSNPCTWTELNTNYPEMQTSAKSLENANTQGAVLFKAGSTWAGFDGNVDRFVYGVGGNETIYDFEARETAPQPKAPTNKEECKKDGWRVAAENRKFKNQGDCVSYFQSNGRSNENPVMSFFKSIFNR